MKQNDIVRQIRFPDWQSTEGGKREVMKALRRTLAKYKLHTDTELFETCVDGSSVAHRVEIRRMDMSWNIIRKLCSYFKAAAISTTMRSITIL